MRGVCAAAFKKLRFADSGLDATCLPMSCNARAMRGKLLCCERDPFLANLHIACEIPRELGDGSSIRSVRATLSSSWLVRVTFEICMIRLPCADGCFSCYLPSDAPKGDTAWILLSCCLF